MTMSLPVGTIVPDVLPASSSSVRRATTYWLTRRRASIAFLLGDLAAILTPAMWVPTQQLRLSVLAILVVLLMSTGKLYRSRLYPSVLDDLPALAGRFLASTAVVATVVALRHQDATYGHLAQFLRLALQSCGLLIAIRAAVTAGIVLLRRRGEISHPTIVVGGGPLSAEMIEILARWRVHGLQVNGFVDDTSGASAASESAIRLGRVEDLPQLVAAYASAVILVGQGTFSGDELARVLSHPCMATTEVFVACGGLEPGVTTGSSDHLGGIPVARLRPAQPQDGQVLKRFFDIAVSGLALVVLAPLMLACALAVRFECGCGVIFRQSRVGQNGNRFDLLKFRSMRPLNDYDPDTAWTIAGFRVGPIGRFLRRSGLDELPQLWNILKGEMSIVGPRPERPHFAEKYSAEYPGYERRYRVNAGLTGLAQSIGLRGDTSIADRARIDNYYIDNWSLWLDIKVLIRTLRELLSARR
jgi:exopolysaccharide biosynthesis polyprenyl glycosylphosphotransferase